MNNISKSITLFLIVLTVPVFLVGCGSKLTYTVRTKDSREYQTLNEPDITDDRYVKFTTVAGQKVLLKQLMLRSRANYSILDA